MESKLSRLRRVNSHAFRVSNNSVSQSNRNYSLQRITAQRNLPAFVATFLRLVTTASSKTFLDLLSRDRDLGKRIKRQKGEEEYRQLKSVWHIFSGKEKRNNRPNLIVSCDKFLMG
ncbi:hypothetical protein SUGI_0096380 [Cryptomeria japonica]|nr:hypothetical protein SUGI_0096380 [Cryptomeria japonica]